MESEAGKAVVGSFLRRFSRLSAKTRSKYRNELRRSNSLLDLRSHSDIINQSESSRDPISPSQSEHSNSLLSEWIGRRLRTRQRDTVNKPKDDSHLPEKTVLPLHTQSDSQLPETYVGNTLLKEKPRLRVRNCENSRSATLGTHTQTGAADYDPTGIGQKNPTGRSVRTLPNCLNSTSKMNQSSSSELSDMEQVLFRAARLRSRRVRSASNETRHTDRTSQEIILKRHPFSTLKSKNRQFGSRGQAYPDRAGSDWSKL
jgi:hypothetical protein